MIKEDQLRDLFVQWTGLNITLNHGEVDQSYRDMNDVILPINGVMRVDAWVYTPIRTLEMATTSAVVTVIARSHQDAENVKNTLDAALAPHRGTTVAVVDSSGKTFSLTVTIGSAYRDEAVHGSSYGSGDEYDVVVNLSYIAICNGISSADTALLIDGEAVELQNMTSNMVAAVEESPGDDGLTASSTPSWSFGIEASAILLDNGAGKILLREGMSLKRSHGVHCVELRVNRVPSWYIMVFTRCQIGSAEVNNVGVSFSLAAADVEAMSFDKRWSVLPTFGVSATIGASEGAIVFWGDGDASQGNSGGMLSHTYTDGKNEHTIYVFGSYDAPVTREIRVGDHLFGKRLIYMGNDWDLSGEVNTTLITCAASSLSIDSGYIREIGEDATVSIGDHLETGREWISTLDTVTGIRDAGVWFVYVSEMGV